MLLLLASLAGAMTAQPAAGSAGVIATFGTLPLQFEANAGQTDRKVQYLSRGPGYTLFLTESEAVLALRRRNGKQIAGADLRMQFAGARTFPELSAQDPLDGRVSYFRGNDEKDWYSGIHTWRKVSYQQVYPGVDLVFYGTQGQLEFDFVAAPGADTSAIRLRIAGAIPKLEPDGGITLTAGAERVTLHKPVVYQGEGAARRSVSSRFAISRSNEIAFVVGDYDHSRTLVIDPVLFYASYLGGNGNNTITGIAVNSAGEAYVTGSTAAANFPTTAGTLQVSQPACNPANCTHTTGGDAFVAHISADGTHLLYATYLGGDNEDGGRAITIDSTGDAYVTGYTFSNDFPLVSPYQSLCNPIGQFNLSTGKYTGPVASCEQHPAGEPLAYTQFNPDVFIAKLNPTGTRLLYSTYFGGSGNDNPNGIALDGSGNIYIAGSTSSVYEPTAGFFPNGGDIAFPVTAFYQDGIHGTANNSYFLAFVSKFSADGQTLLYSTTFGGPAGGTLAQATFSMALGQNGVVAIGGSVTSPEMPVKNAIQGSCPQHPNTPPICYTSGFVAAFDTIQSGDASLLFSTYLNGIVPSGSTSSVSSVAMDAQNNVYATGFTQAHDFPATPGTVQSGCTSIDTAHFCGDAFVIKLNSAGGLVWETNYGNGGVCPPLSGTAVTTDANSYVYVAGTTPGCSGPLKNAFQVPPHGDNAFVIALNADASQLLFGSYFGGNGAEVPNGITLDAVKNIYLAGSTTSTALLATTGSFQKSYGGGADNGFVAKITPVFPCNLNGGGAANVADVQMIIGEALGVIPALHDLNIDGEVNIVDTQVEGNAARGLGCAGK